MVLLYESSELLNKEKYIREKRSEAMKTKGKMYEIDKTVIINCSYSFLLFFLSLYKSKCFKFDKFYQ